MAEKKLTIEREDWGAQAEQMLLPACTVISEVRRQVEQGKAMLFGVFDGAKRVAAFVLRIDSLSDGDQGVIVAAAGNGDGTNLTQALLPAIESMFKGCASVRIHTARRGLAKRLLACGYRFEEIVLTKELKNDPAA